MTSFFCVFFFSIHSFIVEVKRVAHAVTSKVPAGPKARLCDVVCKDILMLVFVIFRAKLLKSTIYTHNLFLQSTLNGLGEWEREDDEWTRAYHFAFLLLLVGVLHFSVHYPEIHNR